MKKNTFLLSFILFTLTAFPQEPEKTEIIYSFVPQYLINRGIRIDFEKMLARGICFRSAPSST